MNTFSSMALKSIDIRGNTEKSCMVSYYRQFSTNIKIAVYKYEAINNYYKTDN